jgi:hypothetical protein
MSMHDLSLNTQFLDVEHTRRIMDSIPAPQNAATDGTFAETVRSTLAEVKHLDLKAPAKRETAYTILEAANNGLHVAQPSPESRAKLEGFALGLLGVINQLEIPDHRKAKGEAPEAVDQFAQQVSDRLQAVIGSVYMGSDQMSDSFTHIVSEALTHVQKDPQMTALQERQGLAAAISRGIQALLAKADGMPHEDAEADLRALIKAEIMVIVSAEFGKFAKEPTF